VVENGLNYIELFGLSPDADYPYTAKEDTCTFNATKATVKIDGYRKLPSNKYLDLMNHLATEGPLAISVYAIPF
jgi:cathepsin L